MGVIRNFLEQTKENRFLDVCSKVQDFTAKVSWLLIIGEAKIWNTVLSKLNPNRVLN